MDKREWTPEELELKEALNKLYESDTREPSKPLDLSFMDEPAKKKMPKKQKRLLYIAAIVAIAFVSSFVTLIVSSNDYVSATKANIQRKIFEMTHSVVVATDDEFAEEGETVWEITDFEIAKKAKNLVPELPIPGYVPEEYEFDKLTLHIYENGTLFANYSYCSTDYILNITCQSINPSEYDSTIFNSTQTIELDDRTILLLNDPVTTTKACSVLYNSTITTLIFSNPSISTNDLIAICSSLQ